MKQMNSKSDIIFVKANVHFKSTEDGGKSIPIRSGYRPNHSFEQPKDIRNIVTYVGEIQFTNYEFIYPGETKLVIIKFARVGEIGKYLNIGQKWFIYEVPRLVAEGEILEIL